MNKTREEMTQWVQSVVKTQEIQCEVEHEENRDIIRMGFRLNNAISIVNVVIVAEDEFFQSYGFIDNNAGKRKAEVSEFLMRASASDSGHFALDFENGQISYEFRSPYCAYEKDDDLAVVWWLPVARFEDFGDALLKVILGCATPKEAFEECISQSKVQEGESENVEEGNKVLKDFA